MPQINRRQALLPEGATRLDNTYGTAPGFYLKENRCLFCFLPGVPSEMENLFLQSVSPLLTETLRLAPGHLVTLRSIGIGESDLESRLAGLALPKEVMLGFRAGPDHVETKLWFPAGFTPEQHRRLAGQARDLIGDFVFTIDGIGQPSGSLIDILDLELSARAWRCVFYETLSFGLMASKCAGRNWLLASYCQPGTETLHNSGDVIIRQRIDQPLTVALQENKSVTVSIELALPTGDFCQTHTLTGASDHKRNQAAMLSLDLIRRSLTA